MADTDGIKINEKIIIPQNELEFRTAHSSGPGGQHVNKTESKVLLRFDIRHSPTLQAALSESDHMRLIHKLASRIDSNGILQLSSQDTRSQHKNREIVVDKFQFVLQEGLKKPKPRKKTRPPRQARQRRLDSKKRHGQKKKERSAGKRVDY